MNCLQNNSVSRRDDEAAAIEVSRIWAIEISEAHKIVRMSCRLVHRTPPYAEQTVHIAWQCDRRVPAGRTRPVCAVDVENGASVVQQVTLDRGGNVALSRSSAHSIVEKLSTCIKLPHGKA